MQTVRLYVLATTEQRCGSLAAAVEHGILAVLSDNSKLFQLLVANPPILQPGAHQMAESQLLTACCRTAAWLNRLVALTANGGSSSVAALSSAISSLAFIYNLAR